MFTDCPAVTQIIQMLQPTVMITYLPLNSNKVCSPPSLECTAVDDDRHKDVFTDMWQATGLKHPDVCTDWTVDAPNNVFSTHVKQSAWRISDTVTLQHIGTVLRKPAVTYGTVVTFHTVEMPHQSCKVLWWFTTNCSPTTLQHASLFISAPLWSDEGGAFPGCRGSARRLHSAWSYSKQVQWRFKSLYEK
jgi:hypothetical protein